MTYDFRTAAIKLLENDMEYFLEGKYSEMAPLLPVLKGQRKWRWDGFSKQWRALKTDLSARQLTNLRSAIKGLSEPVSSPSDDSEGLSSENFEALTLKVRALQFKHVKFSPAPMGLVLKVSSQELNADIKRAGGVWDAAREGFVFTPKKGSPGSV
jgi:hypothetical protein